MKSKQFFLTALLLFFFFDSVAAKEIDILMLLWREKTPAEQSFLKEMDRSGVAYRVEVVNFNRDLTALARFLRANKQSILNRDYVYTFGTNLSGVVKNALDGKVKQIFNISSSPIRSGLAESVIRPGKNLTGCSNRIPLSRQIEISRAIIPFDELIFVFNSGEKNTRFLLREIDHLSKYYGFKLKSHRISDTGSIRKILDKIGPAPNKKAIYFPMDSFLIAHAAPIMKVVQDFPVKVLAAHRNFILNGGTLGVVPNYKKLGRCAAKKLLLSLQSATPLSQIPVGFDLNPEIIISRREFKKWGGSIPEDFQSLKIKWVK